MGDKGGKKIKDKDHKQKELKHAQELKDKQNKQPKSGSKGTF
jgi:hypothetical protein